MSIATRIQSMEEHISDAYDSLSKFGVAAPSNKNIENIASLVDEIYDSTPKTDYVSGTDLTLENTRIGKIDFKDTDAIEKIGLGATNQYTTTGKNLLIPSATTIQSDNGITRTTNSDGSVTLSGTASADAYLKLSDDLTLESDTAYTTLNQNANLPTGVSIYYNNVANIGSTYNNTALFETNARLKAYTTGTVTGTTTISTLIKKGTSFSTPLTLYPMLVKGTVTTSNIPSYEKYSGGTPAPNPEYPQNIDVVTGDISIKTNNKNLWGGFTFTKTSGGLTFVLNKDGSITISGTLTDTNASSMLVSEAVSNNIFVTLPAGTYTVSGGGSDYRIQIYSTSGAFIAGIDTGWSNNTFTLTEETKLFCRVFVPNSGTTLNKTIYIQLEEGTTVTSYAPHQENNYEINLPVENLFNKDDITMYKRLTQNGTLTENGADINYTSSFIKVNANTNYVRSIGSDSVYQRVCFYSTNAESGFLSYVDTLNFTTPSNCTYVKFSSYLSLLNEMQLEEGTISNAYTPYGTTPIELCQISGYQDYIYKNNGNWYIHKEIGKVTWNGTENWTVNPGISTTYVIARPSDLAVSNNNVFYNYFSTVADLSTATEGARIGSSINLKNPNITNLASFKSWLSTHNTIMYYQSSTPTETQITDENLIAQLDAWYNAQSMNDITYITVDGNLPMQLKLRALKK